MKWKLSFAQKIRSAAALVVVFLLVLGTNMMDNHHFSIVKESLTSVYEDRLVAKGHLYKITRLLQLKKNTYQLNDGEQMVKINQMANDSIQVLLDKFGTTRLTENEVKTFESLKSNLNKLYKYDQQLSQNEISNNDLPFLDVVESQYIEVMKDLDALSQIQMSEGKREVINSNRAIETSELISQIEMAALILIGFIIQLLIFVKPLK